MGLFNTAAFRPIVFLPPTSSLIHLQRRHASYRCTRPLPAKAGTITNEFCQQIRNSRKFTRFFLRAAKLGHGTYSFTSPPKEGILRIFRTPEKSNPRTRFPVASMLTTRPPKLSRWWVILCVCSDACRSAYLLVKCTLCLFQTKTEMLLEFLVKFPNIKFLGRFVR